MALLGKKTDYSTTYSTHNNPHTTPNSCSYWSPYKHTNCCTCTSSTDSSNCYSFYCFSFITLITSSTNLWSNKYFVISLRTYGISKFIFQFISGVLKGPMTTSVLYDRDQLVVSVFNYGLLYRKTTDYIEKGNFHGFFSVGVIDLTWTMALLIIYRQM